MKNNRMIARNEANSLLHSLSEFLGDIRSPKRKMYRPEINLLIRGRSSFQRMIMFSKETNASILMNFGLAFVSDDHPKAFSYLNKLISETLKYGEPKGRFQKFLAVLERYPTSSQSVLSITVLITAVLLYLLWGIKLP